MAQVVSGIEQEVHGHILDVCRKDLESEDKLPDLVGSEVADPNIIQDHGHQKGLDVSLVMPGFGEVSAQDPNFNLDHKKQGRRGSSKTQNHKAAAPKPTQDEVASCSYSPQIQLPKYKKSGRSTNAGICQRTVSNSIEEPDPPTPPIQKRFVTAKFQKQTFAPAKPKSDSCNRHNEAATVRRPVLTIVRQILRKKLNCPDLSDAERQVLTAYKDVGLTSKLIKEMTQTNCIANWLRDEGVVKKIYDLYIKSKQAKDNNEAAQFNFLRFFDQLSRKAWLPELQEVVGQSESIKKVSLGEPPAEARKNLKLAVERMKKAQEKYANKTAKLMQLVINQPSEKLKENLQAIKTESARFFYSRVKGKGKVSISSGEPAQPAIPAKKNMLVKTGPSVIAKLLDKIWASAKPVISPELPRGLVRPGPPALSDNNRSSVEPVFPYDSTPDDHNSRCRNHPNVDDEHNSKLGKRAPQRDNWVELQSEAQPPQHQDQEQHPNRVFEFDDITDSDTVGRLPRSMVPSCIEDECGDQPATAPLVIQGYELSWSQPD